ncbi:MAG: dTDP-glucose 4,6-dehydratase [Candidatus Paceibacterales bacterium]
MKVLITGMSGFVATNFFQFLNKKAGKDIDCYGFDLLHGQDLRDAEAVEKAVKDMDLIVHFGALTHVDSSIKDPKPFFKTNIWGTFNVLQAATKYKVKMIQIASSEVYGNLAKGFELQSEDGHPLNHPPHPLNAHSPYAYTKIAQERMCYAWWQTYGTDVRIVRPFNQYGPGQDIRKVIPKFMHQIVEGKPITIYGGGKQRRDWVFIENTCSGIWKSRNLSPGETINLCTGKNYSVWELVDLIKKTMPKHIDFRSKVVKIMQTSKRVGELNASKGDPSKAEKLLGWRAKTSLEEGLRKTWDWFVGSGGNFYLGGDPRIVTSDF